MNMEARGFYGTLVTIAKIHNLENHYLKFHLRETHNLIYFTRCDELSSQGG
jgi:hypothetical protein